MLLGVCAVDDSSLRGGFPEAGALPCRYLLGAVAALRNAHADIEVVVFTDGASSALFKDFPQVEVAPRRTLLLSQTYARNLHQAAKKARVDVLVAPASTMPCDKRADYARIALIFDLLPWRVKRRNNADAAEHSLPRRVLRACRLAQGIVCPSQAAQKLSASLLGVGMEKISVAPPGINPVFDAPQAPVVRPPYALLPINPYTLHGLPHLVEALKKRPEHFPPTLVVTGPAHPDEPSDWGRDIIRVESCPPNMTAALLQHAALFLYPAPWDMSAMPVLEAMRAGVPVIAPRSGAIPEIAGNAPFYCDSQNSASIIQTMRRFCEETPKERVERVAMGRGSSLEYVWERCAWKLVAAVRRVG